MAFSRDVRAHLITRSLQGQQDLEAGFRAAEYSGLRERDCCLKTKSGKFHNLALGQGTFESLPGDVEQLKYLRK